jgi:hypothetical protein
VTGHEVVSTVAVTKLSVGLRPAFTPPPSAGGGGRWWPVGAPSIKRTQLANSLARSPSSDTPSCQTESMTTPLTLQFELEGQPLRFPVEDLERFTSPFTGRQLRRAQTAFTISPDDAETAKRLLSRLSGHRHRGDALVGSPRRRIVQ